MINLTNFDVWLSYSVFGIELLLIGFVFIAWLFSSKRLAAWCDKYDTAHPILLLFFSVYIGSKIAMYAVLYILDKEQVHVLLYMLMCIDAFVLGFIFVVFSIILIPELRTYIAKKRGIY